MNRSRNPLNTPKSIESTTIQIICLLLSSCGYNYVRTYGRPASGIKSRDPSPVFFYLTYIWHHKLTGCRRYLEVTRTRRARWSEHRAMHSAPDPAKPQVGEASQASCLDWPSNGAGPLVGSAGTQPMQHRKHGTARATGYQHGGKGWHCGSLFDFLWGCV